MGVACVDLTISIGPLGSQFNFDEIHGVADRGNTIYLMVSQRAAAIVTHPRVASYQVARGISGRKVNLDVTQLLNIAMALEVPPSYLLAPIGDPSGRLDLPGLSNAFKDLTVIQFDAWLAGLNATTYPPSTIAERGARLELEALRELSELTLEVRRLSIAVGLEREQSSNVPFRSRETFEERLTLAETQLARLHDYLASAGWDLEEPAKSVAGLKELFARPKVFDDETA